YMRLICIRVLRCQRIGQVRIDQNPLAVPLQQEAALPEPPRMQQGGIERRRVNVRQERIITEDWLDHVFNSLRTRAAPSHMAASFFRAAQRAVCDRPQSGATLNRSAGAY